MRRNASSLSLSSEYSDHVYHTVGHDKADLRVQKNYLECNIIHGSLSQDRIFSCRCIQKHENLTGGKVYHEMFHKFVEHYITPLYGNKF
jgi:hypothetical protein